MNVRSVDGPIGTSLLVVEVAAASGPNPLTALCPDQTPRCHVVLTEDVYTPDEYW
jgi:hypothetical protein